MSLTFAEVNDNAKVSPMMRQYLDAKRAHSDALIMMRLGDFYEFFFDDAILVANVLELTLTARDCGLESKAPMCGVPHHAVDTYLNRLTALNYKVAICEQLETPQEAKGLVKRSIVRIVTPGTVIEPDLIAKYDEHQLVSIMQVGQCYGIASADMATGRIQTTSLTSAMATSELKMELDRFAPVEVVGNAEFFDSELGKSYKLSNISCSILTNELFSFAAVRSFLPLKEATEGDLWARASAGLLSYWQQTQMNPPTHIEKIFPYALSEFMQLSEGVVHDLEIRETIRDRKRQGSLWWALDQTNTAMGSRELKRWLDMPSLNLSVIKQRHDSVEELSQAYINRQELGEALHGVYDLERLAAKIATKSLTPRDLGAVLRTLKTLPQIITKLQSFNSVLLQKMCGKISPEIELAQLLESALRDELPLSPREGSLIKTGYDKQIDECQSASQNGQQWLIELEAKERDLTGIRTLRIAYNRVFGYAIEVTKSNVNSVPEHYVRKQTLANAERYITTELKDLEATILGAEQRLTLLEYEAFLYLRERTSEAAMSLQQTARAVAIVDALYSFAEVAVKSSYIRPEMTDAAVLELKDARHPVVERCLSDNEFVGNDIELAPHHHLMVLTGPNMAGKSTYMRQMALIAIMAQAGSFVPASYAKIGIVDRLFTRIGASDDLGSGKSTFMVEMSEVADILAQATPSSLILFDEVGRGTSTFDGLAIAFAVVEHLANVKRLKCRTMFATHYHELIGMEKNHQGVFNAHVAVAMRNGEIIFLHRVKAGGTDDSYGIEVAALAGVSASVVQRAREVLIQLEQENKGKRRLFKQSIPDNQLDMMKLIKSDEEDPWRKLGQRISTIDLNEIRPIEAIGILDNLKQEITKLLK